MSIKTIADKIMKGIYSQGWTVIGYGGSWAGACKPLETYIEKRVAKAVRAERERIIAANAPEIERINALEAWEAAHEACARGCEDDVRTWSHPGSITREECAAAIRTQAADRLARHGINPCPDCHGVGYDASGQLCWCQQNPSF
jgi:hypothetical protein